MRTEHSHSIILGAGISGLGAFGLLDKLGKNPILVDRNSEVIDSEENASIYLDPSKVEFLVKSPGISPRHAWLNMARSRNIPILSEIELARSYFRGKIVALTGTDGKSTTTSLTHHFLSIKYPMAELGGNIGRSFSDFCREDTPLAVLELSSYQLEDSSENLRLDYSAILNIAPDHLERHGTMEKYIQAKCRIIDSDNPNHNFFTSSKTYSKIKDFLPRLNCRLHILENVNIQASPAEIYANNNITRIDESKEIIQTPNHSYSYKNFPLQGSHNLENLAFSIMIADAMEVNFELIQESIPTFKGLSHRFETFYTSNHLRFINDSKSTNLHSLLAWLKNYNRDRNTLYLLLGGRPKEEPLDDLISMVGEIPKKVYVFGEAVEKWKPRLIPLGSKIQFHETMEECLIQIKSQLKRESDQPTDIILSPACASFDQFKNFEERGNHFKELVLNLF